jgi:ribosome biogenesis GTPase
LNDPETIRPQSQSLEAWGYDTYFQQRFQSESQPGEEPGRVLRTDMRSLHVKLTSGDMICQPHPSLHLDAHEQPTTGDFVRVDAAERLVTGALERRTAVVRAAAENGRGQQILAANVDIVLVAEPLGEPWRPRRLERLLVVAWQSGALPVVILTKADQSPDIAVSLREAASVAPAVAVHAVSAVSGQGLEAVEAELVPGATAVIIGRSGAGKSTLANALSRISGKGAQATQPVRDDGKGRHTTVTRDLVMLANGSMLIDTPGVRSIGLTDSEEAIGDAFSDIETFAEQCRFNDCGHSSEPDCAVSAAINSGLLDEERLSSYRLLLREQARFEAKSDRRLRAERAAEMRRFYRQTRNQGRS